MPHFIFFKRFRWSHIVGTFTILGAGCAIILSQLEVFKSSIAENVIIGLLALIAIDALIERLQILERIEKKLSQDTTKQVLRGRNIIPGPNLFAQNASSISVIAISAVNISNASMDFFERKLKDGCIIKFILLSPDSKYLEALEQQHLDVISTKPQIQNTLKLLLPLTQRKELKGCFEIRLSEIFLPFSMVGVDFGKHTGKMIIEYHCYKIYLDEYPHILLEKESNPFWLDFYQRQFELVWNDAKEL